MSPGAIVMSVIRSEQWCVPTVTRMGCFVLRSWYFQSPSWLVTQSVRFDREVTLQRISVLHGRYVALKIY